MFHTTMVEKYIGIVAGYGIGRPESLSGTGLDEAKLSNPNFLISLDQYQALVANLYRLTNDSGIAFKIGRSIHLSDFGIVGYAMVSSRTMRQAAEVWCKYSNSLVGQITETTWDDSGEDHKAIFHCSIDREMLYRFETEVAMARSISIMNDLTGTAGRYRSVSFSYPEPPHRALYDEVMKCPVQFDAPQTVLRFIGSWYDTPIHPTNQEMLASCLEHGSKVMNLKADSNLLLHRLHSVFLSRPGQLPTIHEVSSTFGMSVRTLIRKLEASGKTYQKMKDAFRYDLASAYLLSGHMSSKQVAYLLGFNSTGNFARAFKTWSGHTVTEFLRESARLNPHH